MFVKTNCVVFVDSNDQMPIVCPYDIVDDVGKDPGILGRPGVDLSTVSSNFYKQYQAALALVPCDATAVRVFTTDDIEEKEYTIGVIFVYDKSVAAIENWLE